MSKSFAFIWIGNLDDNYGIFLAGICLKKKQKWTIIYNSQIDCVYLQSPLQYYLSTDKYGRLRCDTLDLDIECCFQLEYNRHGQWAFKSMTYGMYLGGDNDQLHCFSKVPEWWSPHLALHPQVIDAYRTKFCLVFSRKWFILSRILDQSKTCTTQTVCETQWWWNSYWWNYSVG